MRIMSREFTMAEKILLLILVVFLLGLVYYRFVEIPVQEAVASYEADIQMYQTQIDIVQQRILRLQSLKSELKAMEENGSLSYLASYNNSQEEVAFLNKILADTLQYTIAFENVSRSDDLIRRTFSIRPGITPRRKR